LQQQQLQLQTTMQGNFTTTNSALIHENDQLKKQMVDIQGKYQHLLRIYREQQ
jgi:hypothetical protein